MGGLAANQIAATYPERLTKSVLIGPVNPNPAVAGVMVKRAESVTGESKVRPRQPKLTL